MKVVISGYYGFGNLGDEAILHVLLEELRSRKLEEEAGAEAEEDGIEPVVLSAAPRETARLYGVRAVDRWNLRELRRELRTADAFISGGGGLLQDETSRRSALYYLALLAYARRHGPVYLVGQGLGPLRSRFLTAWARRVVSKAAFATVRDEPSEKLLRLWGLPEERLARGGDLTLLLQPKLAEIAREDPEKPYVLVALRGDLPDDLQEALAQQLEHVRKELGLHPIFFAFHPAEDREAMEELAARMVPRPPVLQAEGVPLCEALRAVGGARAVVGMRLHALIFALLWGVPFLAVGGPTKLETFLRQAERAGAPALPCATPEQIVSFEVELAAVLEDFRRGGEALRERLRSARDTLYRQTRRAMDAFLRRLREDLYHGRGEAAKEKSQSKSESGAS